MLRAICVTSTSALLLCYLQARLYLGFVQRRVHEADILRAADEHGLCPCQAPEEAARAGFVDGMLRLLAFGPTRAGCDCMHLLQK